MRTQTQNRKDIYLFIKNRGRKTTLDNIRLFALKKGITQQEMGYAIKQLRDKRAVFLTRKDGFVA